MEFDKSRVFSAVNADELKVGSKCVFVDYLLKTGCIERIHSTSENPVYKIVKPIIISAG